MKLPLFLFLFAITLTCIAQNDRSILYGSVKDSIGNLPSVHAINTNTNQGTFTNDDGEFRILAKEGDTIQLSFVGYKTKNILLEKVNFGMSINSFVLEKDNEILDEVIVKKNKLTGVLALDIKRVPEDNVDKLIKEILEGIMTMDLNQVDMSIDEIDRAKAPIVKTDPIGSGATLFSGSLFTSNKKRVQYNKIDKLKRREQFFNKLFKEINKEYFINELGIANENIYHFIDYCSAYRVQKLFNEEKILELIKLFEEQSVAYLQTIKN